MLWVKVSVTALEYTDYNTGSMKQIKENIRLKKGLDSWLSLVSYGNPQTGMLDVRPTCVKQRNAQQRNMIGGKETCTFDTEVTNSDEAI